MTTGTNTTLRTVTEAEESLIWVYLPIYELDMLSGCDDSVPGAILHILMGDITIFGLDLAAKEEIDVQQRLFLGWKFIHGCYD